MIFFNKGNFIKSGFLPALIGAGLWFLAGPALAALPGDCDGDGTVSIAEVQSGINSYLGLNSVSSCLDTDGNGVVGIDEVQRSINAFLGLITEVSARQVTGVVKDPVNGDVPAAGAVVKAYPEGSTSPRTTATVQANGSYSVTGLTEGRSYYFVFSRTGYGDVTYYGIKPSLTADTLLDPVLLLPVDRLTQTAAINGYLKNASDNTGLPYVSLMFRAGIGATTGDLVPQTKTTNAEGYYARNYFPAGCYTAEVVGMVGQTQKTLGYFTVYAVPGVPAYNNSQNYAVSTGTPALEAYRAVLSWGNVPQDLDFHLTGPLAPGDDTTTIGSNETPRFHIDSTQTTYPYDSGVPASSPTIPGASTDSYLDIDQVDHGTDNGSETMTILKQRTGTYRFYVYNNSTSGTLSGSGAKVRLYKGATLLSTFTVPAQAGNSWRVFDLDGATIVPVNTMSTVAADQLYNLAKRVADFPDDEQLLFRPLTKSSAAR